MLVGGDIVTVSPPSSVLLLLWCTTDDEDVSGAEERGAFVVVGVAEIVSEEEGGGEVLDASGDGASAMEITMGVMPPVFVDGDVMVAVWMYGCAYCGGMGCV